jgi:acyl-CoA dehydrogenase
VGLEGVGLCERAYQRALAFARSRVQGPELGAKSRDKVAIIRHPDVRRMLLQMKSRTEALRAVACVVAAAMDAAAAHPDAAERQQQQAFVDLMIPIVKGWSTETAVLVTSLGVQVHGGMGYIEETGAAQHLRDARITPIYEGTTGIQAADLLGRKVVKDGGRTLQRLIAQISEVGAQLGRESDGDLQAMGRSLDGAIQALSSATAFILAAWPQDARRPSVGAVPFLELLGLVVGGWQMGRAALVSQAHLAQGGGDAEFFQAKVLTARFYADHVLSGAAGLAHTVVHGADAALALHDAQF